MGRLLNIVTKLHKKTKRNYIERMINDKVHCMRIAKKYGRLFNEFGYTGDYEFIYFE